MKKAFIVLVYLAFTVCLAFAEPTAEEILQKVADNYGKIEDMSADVTSTTIVHIEGQPEEQMGPYYKKQYQKKPDKVKLVDTVDNSYLLINGNDIYIKNEKAGLQQIQIDQQTSVKREAMDFYYNTTKFKEAHVITTIEHTIQNGKNIYKLEIAPKESNQTYGKFILTINYDDGLLVKQEMYNESGQLLLTAELLESEPIAGVQIPAKTRETKYCEDGYTINNVTLSNIELNTGLSDTLFNPQEEQ